jgi:hypothetical protein
LNLKCRYLFKYSFSSLYEGNPKASNINIITIYAICQQVSDWTDVSCRILDYVCFLQDTGLLLCPAGYWTASVSCRILDCVCVLQDTGLQ